MSARRVSLAFCSALSRCSNRGFCILKDGIVGCVCPPGLNADCSPVTTTPVVDVVEERSHFWNWVFGAIVLMMIYFFLGFLLKRKYPEASLVAIILWPVTLVYSAIIDFSRRDDDV